MPKKQVPDLCLTSDIALKDAARGFLISLKSWGRYSSSYLASLGLALRLLGKILKVIYLLLAWQAARLAKLPQFVDWILLTLPGVIVIATGGFFVWCIWSLIVVAEEPRNSRTGQILSLLDDHWKIVLVLLGLPLFYLPVRSLIKRATIEWSLPGGLKLLAPPGPSKPAPPPPFTKGGQGGFHQP
jgi:hypothetical protein